MRLIKFAIVIACSAAQVAAQDAPDSQDHPLISRFPNTEITEYSESNFERFKIAIGPITQEIRDEQGRTALPPAMQLEGRVTSITYRANDTKDAPFAIFRNYERALSEAGFETIYQCESDAGCGERFARQLYYYGDPKRQGRHRGLSALNIRAPRDTYFYWSGDSTIDQTRYVVSLLVVQNTNGSRPSMIVLDVNEVDVLDDDRISVSPEELSSQLETEGRVVLDGVYFAFDNADLDPRSEAAIATIASLMATNSEDAFYVVGHTDSTGSIEYNQELSLARARSVVSELTQQHGVDPVKVIPFGVGPVSPISTNQTDAGRALNRRVELVLRTE